jgi:hypothetical protein
MEPQHPFVGSRASAMIEGKKTLDERPTVVDEQSLRQTKTRAGYTLRDYHEREVTFLDIAQRFGAFCASLGDLCSSTFISLANHKVLLPAAFVAALLVGAIRGIARSARRPNRRQLD